MSPFQLSKFLFPTRRGLFDLNFAMIFVLLVIFSRWKRALERKGLQMSGRGQGVAEGFFLL